MNEKEYETLRSLMRSIHLALACAAVCGGSICVLLGVLIEAVRSTA